MRLTILGAPRTKKTSNQGAIARSRKGGQACPGCGTRLRVRVFPSKAWREWVKEAAIQIDGGQLVQSGNLLLLVNRSARAPLRTVTGESWTPIAEPLNCAAVFYRDRDIGDLIGYMQGLADLLEERGVLTDDQWIQRWDGSRLEVTAGRPRVEVELTPLAVGRVEESQL